MKKLILILILISTSLLGQNFEPGHRQFDWLGTQKYISADSSNLSLESKSC